jgi:hypothetical protein
MPTEGRRCRRDNTSETRPGAAPRQDSCRPRGKNHPVRRESVFDPRAWPTHAGMVANVYRGARSLPRAGMGLAARDRKEGIAVPKGKHMGGVSSKEQRQYEHIKDRPRSPGGMVVGPRRWRRGSSAQAEGTFEGPLRACLSLHGSQRRRGRRRWDLAARLISFPRAPASRACGPPLRRAGTPWRAPCGPCSPSSLPPARVASPGSF